VLSRRRILFVVLAASLVAITIIAAISPWKRSSAQPISMAVEFNDHAAAAWVALETGMFGEAGLNITYLETFRTGLELAAALARGDIGVAWACLGPALLTYVRGVPIKIVAGAHLHGYAVVARPGISELSELNGGLVACPGKGSPCYLLLMLVKEKYGLNVTIKKMAPHVALNAVMTGQIDAAALPEHYATLAVLRGGCKVLARSQDVWPNMPGSVLLVREELLENKPEVVRSLVEVTERATRFISEDPDLAAEIVANRLGISYEEAKESMGHLNYTTDLNLTEIQRYIDLMIRYDCLEEPIRAEDVVDTSFLGGG